MCNYSQSSELHSRVIWCKQAISAWHSTERMSEDWCPYTQCRTAWMQNTAQLDKVYCSRHFLLKLNRKGCWHWNGPEPIYKILLTSLKLLSKHQNQLPSMLPVVPQPVPKIIGLCNIPATSASCCMSKRGRLLQVGHIEEQKEDSALPRVQVWVLNDTGANIWGKGKQSIELNHRLGSALKWTRQNFSLMP